MGIYSAASPLGEHRKATLNGGGWSRNLAWRSFVWEALGYVEPEAVWVFDWEFSFSGWLVASRREHRGDVEDAGVRYVVRLAAKQKAYLEDKEGRRLPLVVSKGGQVVWEGVRYRVVASRREHRVDSVSEVNVDDPLRDSLALAHRVVGVWERGHREPLWVMGNLPPGELLGVYRQRMKIEEAFRDLKGYLRMEGVMSKTLENAEKTLRLLAFAYALGLVVGEAMRREWRQKGGLVGGNGGTTHTNCL